jgi:phosphoserine phosphatase
MEKIVVFDFDGTLVQGDTFKILQKSLSNYLIRKNVVSFLFFLFLLYFKLILVLCNKRFLVYYKTFLIRNIEKFNNIDFYQEVISKLVKHRDVEQKMYQFINESDTKVLIVTGSLQYFVNRLFPNVECIATEFISQSGSVRIIQHPYGVGKVQLLKKAGVLFLDVFFTDSFADRPLMDISKEIYYVKNGEINRITINTQ